MLQSLFGPELWTQASDKLTCNVAPARRNAVRRNVFSGARSITATRRTWLNASVARTAPCSCSWLLGPTQRRLINVRSKKSELGLRKSARSFQHSATSGTPETNLQAQVEQEASASDPDPSSFVQAKLHTEDGENSSDLSRQQVASETAAGNGAKAIAPEMEDLLKLVALLPASVRLQLEALPQLPELIEVVMDLGRPPLARFPAGEIQLSEVPITIDDINFAVSQVGDFDGDNRAGIDCTLHRISCIRNRAGKVIGLTCRAGRAISGSAALVEDLVRANKSILLLGRPGVGKTTAIRDIARTLADSCLKRVVIVDTSNEIGGDGDIPHRGIGSARRMQVAQPHEQHRVMIEAVENHMPQVIIIDEISTMAECDAARTIAQRGVQLVATAHGQELENLVKNPSLQDLIGGIQTVTLGDELAKKRGTQKSIQERSAPPTFDVAIEMTERDRWTIHLDVGTAVDDILQGGAPRGQIRERDAKGQVKAVQYVQRTYVNDNNLDNWGGSSSGMSGTVTYHKVRERSLNATDWTTSTPSPTPWFSSSAYDGSDEDLLPRPVRQSASSPEVGAFVTTSPLGIQLTSAPSPAVPTSSSSPSSAPLTASSALPEEDKMKVFFVMDDKSLERLRTIVRGMDTGRRVQEVPELEDADVLVASRKQLRNNTKIRNAAKKLQVPIYAVKASSSSGIMRDLCPLLGLEPCPVPSTSSSSSSEMDSIDEEDEDADFSDDQPTDPSSSGQANTTTAASTTSSTGNSSKSSTSPAPTPSTCAEDWASLLASTVRELRYQPVDREYATSILNSFLAELPDASPGALAAMSWGLAYTKNKKRFLESSAGQLQMLADAITPRLPEFKASELVQVATGFAALKYFPGDEFWDGLDQGCQKFKDSMNEREIKAIQTSFQVLDSLRIMSADVAAKV